MRLFSTEQVSKYHPDKYADQISDAILDACLAQDPLSHVGCEVMVKDNTIILGGEIKTNAKIDHEAIARRVAAKLGYQVDRVIDIIGKQSQEIDFAVEDDGITGAGDQGMMVGFATDESPSLLPFAFHFANQIILAIEQDVETNPNTILKGDAKTQVTVDLDLPQNINAVQKILVSVCHKEGVKLGRVQDYVLEILKRIGVHKEKIELYINPAGTWNVGGPTADCGLTGRKIVCDQYGGFVPVGGGAFSGKDPTKVDRSAAYAARQLACEIVINHKVQSATVQIAYAIGVAKPLSIYVSTSSPEKDAEIAASINYDDFTPDAIIKRLQLRSIKYEKLAEGCHYR